MSKYPSKPDPCKIQSDFPTAFMLQRHNRNRPASQSSPHHSKQSPLHHQQRSYLLPTHLKDFLQKQNLPHCPSSKHRTSINIHQLARTHLPSHWSKRIVTFNTEVDTKSPAHAMGRVEPPYHPLKKIPPSRHSCRIVNIVPFPISQLHSPDLRPFFAYLSFPHTLTLGINHEKKKISSFMMDGLKWSWSQRESRVAGKDYFRYFDYSSIALAEMCRMEIPSSGCHVWQPRRTGWWSWRCSADASSDAVADGMRAGGNVGVVGQDLGISYLHRGRGSHM